MSLKIGRRPFRSCPFRWRLDVADINTGQGDVSDALCDALNGSWFLDWRSCISTGNELVWEAPCEQSAKTDFSDRCGELCYTLSVTGADGPGDVPLVNGDFALTAVAPHQQRCRSAVVYDCSYETAETVADCVDGIAAPTWFMGSPTSFGGVIVLLAGYRDNGLGGVSAMATYTLTSGDPCLEEDLTFAYANSTACAGTSGWPSTLTLVYAPCAASNTNPEHGDQVRAKWRLTYDIESETFTLRSFNRVAFPIYSLVDPDPCDGTAKVLTLADSPPDADSGCMSAPPTVTIMPDCAPERPARIKTLDGITGGVSDGCCKCDDEVDDRRTDADVNCEFPASLDACVECEDPPCAYEALFGACNISHNGYQIAAKTVTMRHKCFYEDVCDWVAVGPTPNEHVGAEPTCFAPVTGNFCYSFCSWDGWAVAQCPSGPCGPIPCNVGDLFETTVGTVFDELGNVLSASQTLALTTAGSAAWAGIGTRLRATMGLQEHCERITLYADGLLGGLVYSGSYVLTGTTPVNCSGSFTFAFLDTANVGSSWPATLVVTRA